jgi:hypothetical protein
LRKCSISSSRSAAKTNESASAPEFVADVRHALEHYGTKTEVYDPLSASGHAGRADRL